MFRSRSRASSSIAASKDQVRPEGELVWCHATDANHAEIALRLADRLTNERPDIHLLLTTTPTVALPERRSVSTLHAVLPSDNTAAAQAFLDHWNPDVCIWTAGDIKPNLLTLARRKAIPLYLVDADETRLSRSGWRWLPTGHWAAFRHFSAIMARSSATEEFLRRKLGLRDTQISVTGPLRQESRPLPCNEAEREELAHLLMGRPVWLAAHLHEAEFETILAANLNVTRVSHRVLLVVSPENPGDLPAMRKALDSSGLRFMTWSDGALPDETTQVILADTPEELGLWYRIAPITFMGMSLSAESQGSDPNEPAAHGSAILYGPNVRNYLDSYSRFAEAGAARIVRDADTLAAAIKRIIPPDQSAAMAHAAWDVATQSAAVMDSIVHMIMEALDKREVV